QPDPSRRPRREAVRLSQGDNARHVVTGALRGRGRRGGCPRRRDARRHVQGAGLHAGRAAVREPHGAGQCAVHDEGRHQRQALPGRRAADSRCMTSAPAGRIGAGGRARVDYRAIVAFAAPLMATNAIQAVLNLTDTWFIGRLSTHALAGMSAIYWVMTCLILVLGGVSFAVQTFVAQAIGSGRRARASQAAWSGLWASACTFPVFVLLAWLGPALLAPFNLEPAIERLAIEYWQPRMLGAALGLGTWSIAGFFTGVGASRTTFAIAGVTMLANVPANQFF